MKVYIDKDFKCYSEFANGLTFIETDFFDGKCKTFIEGYRFIPAGETWAREDGTVFTGEMIAPWKDYRMLEAAQQEYEKAQAEIEDMKAALAMLGVTDDE